MEEHSIRIEIAGRAYPLNIHADEEGNIRQAAQEINESITRLRTHYPLTDKQDLLAMAALEVSVRALNGTVAQEQAAAVAELDRLEELLQAASPG
ncbi:MAG: cell division protein ZapA [Flavobacteriales bacterium]|jgi:cell division protein ZapA|nr:cell division protein ZapA [Flavobacteriales bacterium]MBK6752891.1 cell division protein ZapA [Flavobacteriales bacterium]MBK7085293.1 cell division protein ZapA [Flavobacteriales bacterium]MBK7271122.1 cell division protein ZapA [Flavobacteriales bacterium]MBK7754492.1 cell division protein ZapA [Flavobacteriales bacterium]